MHQRGEQLCEELKTLAERAGLKVREEALLREVGYHPRSGTCRVRGEELLFVDRTLPVSERVAVLTDELRRRDLRGLYMSPLLRRLLGGSDDAAERAHEVGDEARTDPDPPRS
jgi:hypothetical protein